MMPPGLHWRQHKIYRILIGYARLDLQKVYFKRVNPLMGTLKSQSSRPLYSNKVIGTLAVDGWAVTFGTTRRAMADCCPAQSPPRCTRCNSTPIYGQCTSYYSKWHYNYLCALKG